MSYWCRWAWLGGETAVGSVLLSVEAGSIVAVDVGVPAPDGVEVLDGLTLPGFANTHSHAFHRALRGRTHQGAGSFWTWRQEMYRLADTLDPDAYHLLARRTFAEMVAAGYTAVGEFHYLHHPAGGGRYHDANETGRAVIAAAVEVGIRITLLDTLYLHGGIDTHTGYRAPDPVQRRFTDGDVAAWIERVEALRSDPVAHGGPHSSVRVGAAVHSVRAVDPDSIRVAAEWASGAGVPLHAHVSEQPAENEACLAAHGLTPTGVLAAAGALGASFTAVHATHLTDDDVSLLGGSGSTVCMCPTTERDLADGVGPSLRLVRAGAGLAMGSDSQAVIDPFEEARAVELDQRLVTLRRGNHTVAELLTAATAGGYAALGLPEAGRLAPGAPADLVTVDLGEDHPPDVLPAAVLFGAGPAHVTRTVVGGVTVGERR